MESTEKTQKQEKNTEYKENQDLSLEDRKKAFKEEYEALRKKYSLDMSPEVDFYEYKVLPAEVQLALVILSKHPMRYIFNLVEIKQDDNKS